MPSNESIAFSIHGSRTSKEANRLLGWEGEFWQEDYFDHTIRSSKEFDRTIRYVLENPAKAGLVDWRWVPSYPERLESAGEMPADCGRDARAPRRNRNAP